MKFMNQKTGWFAGASMLALGLSAVPAAAQDADSEASDSDRRLSTVTVTATQRAESIQDVPIAITALDPEILDRAGVTDVSNLQAVAPSFNMNSSDTTTGGTSLRIRGVGTTGNNIGLESSVGVFMDGVYLSRPGVALGDLMDLEQIEVLRGPQGTLFGRNTSAGALNIKTKAPTLNEYEGFANLSVGNYDLVNVQAGINIPVIDDTLAFRISGAVRERAGFVEGINGDESHNRDRTVLRAQGLLDLKEAGTFRMILDHSEAEENCCHAVWHNDTGAAAAFIGGPFEASNGGAPVTDGLEDLRSNDQDFFNPFESTGLSLEYNVETGIGDLTYIGSYRDFESETFRSTDYVSTDIFTVGRSPEARAVADGDNFDTRGNITNIETITHEVRLQNTAFNDRLDWLVGAYYSDEQIESHGSLTLLDDYQSAVSAGLLGSPVNLLNILSGGVDASGDFATNNFDQSGESISIFTHNIFSVTDRLDLTVGVRYVEETKDGSFNQSGGEFDACLGTFNNIVTGGVTTAGLDALTGAGVALNCFIFAAPTLDAENFGALFPALTNTASPLAGLGALLPREFSDTFEDEEVVYTVKLGYDLSDDVSVYGGFTHGFKSGGFNLDASAAGNVGPDRGDPRFDSEKVDAWEFGMKGEFWDGRARANVAVFQQDLEDFQVLEFTGIKFETFNVGKAESSGIEIETEAQLNDYFYGGLALTYTDTKYPSDCATDDPTDPAFIPQAANLCGATLTNAPDYVLVGNLGYENEWLGNEFFANMNVRHEDDRRTSTQPSEIGSNVLLPGDIQQANTKINLRVGLANSDNGWSVELWGNNVTDERTKNVTFSIPLRGGAGNRARGQFSQDPQTYGVTLRKTF